jgi:hypothetical protein
MTRSLIRAGLLTGLLLLLIAPAAPAAEPWGVALLRPDSLAGWQYGDWPIAGWQIAEGRLTGTAGATPLLSGFTFGEFEIRFQWSTADGGSLDLLLPEVPKGKGLCLSLREGEGCGRLTDDKTTLAPGGKVEPAAAGRMHAASLRHSGGKLVLSVDGRQLDAVDVTPGRRFGLGLAASGGKAVLADLRGQEPSGWPIFSGRDLAGWWCPDKLTAWQPQSGELVLEPGGGNYLRTKKDYANFTLSLEYLIVKRGNSGIGIRTPQPGWPSSDGMELQIEDVPGLDQHKTMAIYGNVPPLARADLAEQWNRVVVKADGRMIAAWGNGQLVQQCNTADHPELKHRRLAGWIGFQDHGGWIRLRNIRVLEAPDGVGLDAWHRPRPRLATSVLLDRLMNPERLSIDDGIRSGTVTAAAPKSGTKKEKAKECVLAQLTGPGAVVRVARTSDDGRLAFYFDGQSRPGLECKPADLWSAGPMLCEDRNPALTCLTYRKSLRIVLRDARQAEYRIDYVTFPPDLEVQSFTDPQSGLARGWLAAVQYRAGQNYWGVVRQHDALPRLESAKKTLSPGRTQRLVHADGAGIVEWLQLTAPKQVLDTNDLWLEVTVDGQPAPSVSAPARFLFPGLAGQGNYPNYVMTERDGLVSRLAMPFGAGIAVAARNAGRNPIAGVGATLCVRPADPSSREEIAGRMRLRGVFLPAGRQGSELIHLQGAGRWVGLVCQQPGGPPVAIDALTIDGRAAEGWRAASGDGFLGPVRDFRSAMSGRHGPLAWRYLMLDPVDFRQSLVVTAAGEKLGDRLVLYYGRQ